MRQDKTMNKSLLPEPTGKTETISLHFRVDGDGMTRLAVSLFWFEDREKHAMKVLDSFSSLTPEQKNKIIWGDAKITGISICGDENCHQCKGEKNPMRYVEETDKKTKSEIVKRMKWLEKNCFKMGEFHVDKSVIYQYLGEIKLCENLIETESDRLIDQIRNNIIVCYNSIFQDVTQLPPRPEDMPKYGTRRYEFAIELERFLQENKDALLISKEVKKQVSRRLIDLQKDRLMAGYEIDQTRKKASMGLRKSLESLTKPEEKLTAFTQKEIEDSPKIEMTFESGRKVMVPKILLDEYANSVRMTRVGMMLKPNDLSMESIISSQKRLNTRIDHHKAIYNAVGIVYHLEHEYFQKKSAEQFPDPKGQQFFRKMTDEERESLEFNELIQQYVEKKYPDISMKTMFGKTDENETTEKNA